MSTLQNPVPTSAADKEKLLALLRESRQRFLASFAGVTDEQSRRRPAENCWCVLDTVEHIASAEAAMLRIVQDQRRPRPAGAPNREDIFMRVLTDRSRKMESPEPGLPKGRFATLAEATEHFHAARDGAMRFVERSEEDLRATEVTHPHPAAGVVTTYEMLIVMAKHAERHALQIEEIKSALSRVSAGGVIG